MYLDLSIYIENIIKAIDQFPWEMRFTNIDVKEKVYSFNKTIKNIFNYIPHERITSDDMHSSWINKDIKN